MLFISCNVFKDFKAKKQTIKKTTNVHRVSVLNLIEISKEFLIFKDLKITETRFE